jgi:hypothetical protein
MAYSSKNPKVTSTILTDQTSSASTAAPSGSHRLIDRNGTLWLVDSSGNETPVGSGTSGINYLSSYSDATKDLGTVQTSVGDTLASSTRSNPGQWGCSSASAIVVKSTDSTLRGTTNYLCSFSANAQFVETALFTIDGEDLGKPLLVQFDVSGVSTADDVQVYVARYNSSNVLQERILVAGTASATTPSSAQVPTNTTTFRGFFITSATATDKYAVRWLRNANNTSMRLDTLLVGPQSLAQGAVVTQWQDYTPTYVGLGTVTSTMAKYRRVGSTIETQIVVTVGTPTATAASVSLPSGLTVDGTSLSSTSVVGFANNKNAGSQSLIVATSGSPSVLNFAIPGAFDTLINGSTFAAAGWVISLFFKVPISQWSSGTTTLADRAVEEYASYNGSTTVYGPYGSVLPTITASAVNTRTTYTVTWQTSILPTDKIVLEVSPTGGTNDWIDIGSGATEGNLGFGKFTMQSTGSDSRYYGMGFRQGSSTTSNVEFGNAGARAATAGAYGATGSNWTGSSMGYWRLRKISGGAAVGFPVSARNIVGDISGTAVPAGYVGEKIDFTQRAVTTVSASYRANTTALATLTTGTYLIFGYSSLPGGTGNNNVSAISTNSNNDGTGFVQANYTTSNYQTSAAGGIVPQIVGYLQVSSGTSQALYAKAYGDSNAPVVTVGGFAVRIA